MATFALTEGTPYSIIFDPLGNLFFADTGIVKRIGKITPSGTVSTFISDVAAIGLAFDNAGNLFASITGEGRIVKITPSGEKTTFANALSNPTGLAFDPDGNLYAAQNGGGEILKFTPSGTRSTYASQGGSNAPFGLTFDEAGRLFVTNGGTGAFNRIETSGAITQLAVLNNAGTFMAFPVPEPATASLFATGLLVPLLRRKREKLGK